MQATLNSDQRAEAQAHTPAAPTLPHLVLGQGSWLRLDTLTLTDVHDDGVGLGASGHGVCLHQLPVIEHALREGLSRRCCTQGGCETERLNDRQVGLDVVHGGTWALHLLKHHTTLLVQHCSHNTAQHSTAQHTIPPVSQASLAVAGYCCCRLTRRARHTPDDTFSHYLGKLQAVTRHMTRVYCPPGRPCSSSSSSDSVYLNRCRPVPALAPGSPPSTRAPSGAAWLSAQRRTGPDGRWG
jgi:hypothetical protein